MNSRRLVFDTNIVVSALLFRNGRLAWLRSEWESGRIVPLLSKDAAAELLRVLSYPKFALSAAERDELLGEYLPFCETVGVEAPPDLPQCRDEADQIFGDLAAAGMADALVTGDGDLLGLAGELPFEVLTPAQLRERA